MTKYLNISTDNTLGGATPSDVTVSSQKAIKEYVDSHSGGGSVAIDNSTITKNADDEIQAVATINANPASGATNPIYDWVGTLAEYKAQDIENAHPEWVCFITDDADGEVSPSKSITNCITEIPQDIKLELNNGTLTLKAGSKLYVPNGGGVFNVREVTADQTYTQSTNGEYLLFARQDTTIWGDTTANCTSGTTAPSNGTFYNTSNNRIDWYSGGTFNDRLYSLPFAKITVSNGAISSIDQVFNGFGYMGSTVFALPGVKGLIPDGRYEDGSLKNIEFETNSVCTATFGGTTNTTMLFISSTGYIGEGNRTYLDDKKNYVYYNPEQTTPLDGCIFGKCRIDSGKVSFFTSKIVFCAVDYSEFAEHKLVSFQAPTAANGYTWYRRYSDGWVEQGGRVQLNGAISSTNKRITFPVAMANVSYNVSVAANANVGSVAYAGWESTTGCSVGTVVGSSANTGWTSWEVKGMAA